MAQINIKEHRDRYSNQWNRELEAKIMKRADRMAKRYNKALALNKLHINTIDIVFSFDFKPSVHEVTNMICGLFNIIFTTIGLPTDYSAQYTRTTRRLRFTIYEIDPAKTGQP